MNRSLGIRRLVLAALLLGFCVVVFGAYVRLTAAGLGCPDWPGCYGHLTPVGAEAAHAGTVEAPLQVGKAWREMIHRYAASTLGLLIVAAALLAFLGRRDRGTPRALPYALVALVVFQGLLGMLTVTWKVKPLIVTSHLIFGLLTVSLLWWFYLSLRDAASGAVWPVRLPDPAAARTARRAAAIGLAALVAQILLGGWTSTNYAAIACPDLPTCQGSWWPDANFHDGFVLWRGIGVNYEGGVLDLASRVAIHLTHRLGAILATAALLSAAFLTLRASLAGAPRVGAWAVACALLLQLIIGVAMVERGFPLALATAHNAGAALLLLATLYLNRALIRTSPAN